MKKKILLIFNFILSFLIANAQEESFYKENAVKIENLEKLNSNIYNLISNRNLYMVGEMHGTTEPASFVNGLANLMLENNQNIQIGLEIPSEDMALYISSPIDKNIYLSYFFSKKAIDGRENYSWAKIIEKFNDNAKVEIFFFDANKNDYKTEKDRDVIMYQKIKTQILKNPTWKTITLSGNVHNMLLNWREEIKAGAYLKSDSQLNITNSILSFNHYYSKGSMINDMGTGLNLRELDNSKATFATSVNYDNYLLVYPDGLNVSHNAIIFSRKITAAKMVSYK